MTKNDDIKACRDAGVAEYCDLLAARNAPGAKAYVRTYGCQQNESDSEKIRGMLAAAGYSVTEDAGDADVLVYNTCAIREHAENRVFGNIGEIKHLRERRKDLIVVLCGCMTQREQTAERVRRQYPFVNIILGTFVLPRLPEYIWRCLNGEKHITDLSGSGGTNEGLPVLRESRIKAWLPVMYGCDNFCSYCVVPYVRGRERSRAPGTVEAEARRLVEDGYKEITLLGQNVNSYGKGTGEGVNFAGLLRMVDGIDGDFIIRFMTSHPKDATDELIETVASGKHIAPQLHLPVQSGSDRILAAMNRRYTAEKYLSLVSRARERIPGLTLTTDVIVGFPGETEEDFLDTLALVREAEYDSMFAFCYSPRPGTPAAEMDGQVPHEVKTERFARLMSLQEEIAQRRNLNLVGRKMRVLLDGVSSRAGRLTGRTPGNLLIEVEAPESMVGTFADIIVDSARAWQLTGALEERSCRAGT